MEIQKITATTIWWCAKIKDITTSSNSELEH
ncbi:hypothetical protein LCGC14_1874950 [marine sediment metagenome]|uniref:Uncharacterized protein n=1 Tax=marine sediment metagenome TaxID=412755 RepID=A0A0F9J2M8_9ZZZZ